MRTGSEPFGVGFRRLFADAEGDADALRQAFRTGGGLDFA